ALVEAIGPDRIHVGSPVTQIAPNGARSWVIAGGRRFEADAVVVATPAFEAASIVRPIGASAADELAVIPYASSAVTILVYPPGTAERLPAGTGFVVADRPPGTGPAPGLGITACTWLSRKWPEDSFGDRAVVR